jgi:histone H3/H4
MKNLTNEQLVRIIIRNSVKAAHAGMVTIQPNDVLAFDNHHPFIHIAQELNQAKDELLRRLRVSK